ncbi:hypothetical protein NQ317_010760 [Molorchus minor]|uniref:Uncharacterized protein n=1 Tax=Molorchus minor TaxID=1323400 RepID=A0ABQ9IRS8_9CUCU|nr:hypothetical protein NQ317_010760 [Molorchus minor]
MISWMGALGAAFFGAWAALTINPALEVSEGHFDNLLLAGHSLQKWLLSPESEQFTSIEELNRLVRDSFHNAVWDNCIGDQAEIDTWVLDIQSDKDCIIILAAAVNMHMSAQMHYAMISFSINGTVLLRDFFVVEDVWTSIIVVKPQEEPDILEFNASGLIVVQFVSTLRFFFQKLHGLITVSNNEQLIGDYMNLSMTGTNTPLKLHLMRLPQRTIYPSTIWIQMRFLAPTKIQCGAVKSRFYIPYSKSTVCLPRHNKRTVPAENTIIPGVDNVLDRIVVTMCVDLLDDIPAGDPRWNKDSPLGIGSSYSMQVLHQLEDKQKVLTLYLKFLKESGLWNRLSAYTIREVTMATVHLLERNVKFKYTKI